MSLDRFLDDRIRAALRGADQKGKLGLVADVVDIAGGEDTLREIMNSTDELHTMDRIILAAALT